MGSVGFAVVRDLRVHVYRHLQFPPLEFHASRSTGGLMSRVTSDVLAIQEALTRVFVDLLRETMTLVGLVAIMFYTDWVLALLVLTVGPVVATVIDALGKRLRRYSALASIQAACQRAHHRLARGGTRPPRGHIAPPGITLQGLRHSLLSQRGPARQRRAGRDRAHRRPR